MPHMTEVLIVDNEGVGKQLRSRFPDERVAVIESPRNLGFGRAANVGLAHARSDAVLVLNQDVVLSSETVNAMLDAGARSGAWIVGSRLSDAESHERSRKVGFVRRWNGRRRVTRQPGRGGSRPTSSAR